MLVAGFQGVSTSRDVTTLGRGGSDTTAVAVAAAIGAEVCEIYTDVAGVFSADPRIVPDARKLPHVSFEEMLEMAASGAKVLQLRSVEYARTHGVRIHCRSSFDPGPGTVVLGEDETMEHPLITAVTHSTDEARITLRRRARPSRRGRVDLRRAGRGQLQRRHDHPERAARPTARDAEVSFTIGTEDLRAAEQALEPVAGRARASPSRHRPRDRQGLDRRRRDALAPGRRRQGVPDARRRGDQHRDDLHLADQDLLRDPRRARAAGGPRAARRVRAGRGRNRARGRVRDDAALPSSAPPASSARRCCSCCASASSRPTRSSCSRPSARAAPRSTAGPSRCSTTTPT